MLCHEFTHITRWWHREANMKAAKSVGSDRESENHCWGALDWRARALKLPFTPGTIPGQRIFRPSMVPY